MSLQKRKPIRSKAITQAAEGEAWEERIRKRIEERTIPVTESGCWLYTGPINNSGYGIISVDDKTVLAHRISYKVHVVDIPEGLQIDHKCRVSCCLNPAHMEVVTAAENSRRRLPFKNQHADKTHCKNGHELSGSNLYTNPNHKHRNCIICTRKSRYKYKAKKRAENAAKKKAD